MAVYKVPQNVEAEDKLIGPFTFRQFIFLIIAAISGYLVYVAFTITPPAIIIPLPFFLVFGFLGVYRREDQPIEVYLLAVVRFFFRPRKKVWDQLGMVDLVKVTAPKVVEIQRSDNLSQEQVRSRLDQLSKVMDTRGWSVKEAGLQEGGQFSISSSDRLAMPTLTQPAGDVNEYDDIYSEQSNEAARYDQIANKAKDREINYAKEKMRASIAEAQRSDEDQEEPEFLSHPDMKVSTALDQQQPAQSYPQSAPQAQAQQDLTPSPQPTASPDIINRLSQADDLDVSAIETIANKPQDTLESGAEIKLH